LRHQPTDSGVASMALQLQQQMPGHGGVGAGFRGRGSLTSTRLPLRCLHELIVLAPAAPSMQFGTFPQSLPVRASVPALKGSRTPAGRSCLHQHPERGTAGHLSPRTSTNLRFPQDRGGMDYEDHVSRPRSDDSSTGSSVRERSGSSVRRTNLSPR
jgi:hypothetical protein